MSAAGPAAPSPNSGGCGPSGRPTERPELLPQLARALLETAFAPSMHADICLQMGPDAAHARWHAHVGPDDLGNGLCLCAPHHRLFDRGVLGLNPDRTVTVSRKHVGRARVSHAMVLDLAGRPVRPPQPGAPEVDPRHIAWHSGQLFRHPRTPGRCRVPSMPTPITRCTCG